MNDTVGERGRGMRHCDVVEDKRWTSVSVRSVQWEIISKGRGSTLLPPSVFACCGAKNNHLAPKSAYALASLVCPSFSS
jgi:hypothetical protein